MWSGGLSAADIIQDFVRCIKTVFCCENNCVRINKYFTKERTIVRHKEKAERRSTNDDDIERARAPILMDRRTIVDHVANPWQHCRGISYAIINDTLRFGNGFD